MKKNKNFLILISIFLIFVFFLGGCKKSEKKAGIKVSSANIEKEMENIDGVVLEIINLMVDCKDPESYYNKMYYSKNLMEMIIEEMVSSGALIDKITDEMLIRYIRSGLGKPIYDKIKNIEVLDKKMFSDNQVGVYYSINYSNTNKEYYPGPSNEVIFLVKIDDEWMIDVEKMIDENIDFGNKARLRRDKKRISDINRIRTALDVCYNFVYPEKLTPGDNNRPGKTTCLIPSNPKSDSENCDKDFEYQYKLGPNGKTYELTYCMEEYSIKASPGINIATGIHFSDRDPKFNSKRYRECRMPRCESECVLEKAIYSINDYKKDL